MARVDQALARATAELVPTTLIKASLYHFHGQADQASEELRALRARVEGDGELKEKWLFTVIYFQGVTALRIGENENCVMCRGESSCILPIAAQAVHTNPRGSRLAIGYFTEYLEQFPDDLEVRWLLNLAHMTLGQHPHAVNSRQPAVPRSVPEVRVRYRRVPRRRGTWLE